LRIAIAQPTYLPWLGYFDLLDQVDRFVLLDSVQFERQSWQQRNRIKTPQGLAWLTIPVVFRGKLNQNIADVNIRVPDFWRDHLRAIELNYRRAPFFERYYDEFRQRIEISVSSLSLSELTISLLHWLAEIIGITTPMVRSSQLPVHGKRTGLLAEICLSLGASAYLSPLGSSEYLLDELPTLTGRGINVAFHHYEHPVYRQLFPPFQPYACILDLLFNEGDNALQIIRSGRRQPWLPEEVASQICQEASC
jgi:WbqC-like protein family